MEMFLACMIMLFAIIIIYIILVKLFISILIATGLSKKVAKFQIFSVFGSTGFSTKESELIMIDPIRRKVIIAAMITSFIFSMLITSLLIGIVLNLDFKAAGSEKYFVPLLVTLGISVGTLVVVIILTTNKGLRKVFSRLIKYMIYRNAKNGNNELIFHEIIGTKYLAAVKLFYIPENMRDITIGDFDFESKGIKVLAVNRKDVVYTDNFKRIPFEKGIEIELFGGAKELTELFY